MTVHVDSGPARDRVFRWRSWRGNNDLEEYFRPQNPQGRLTASDRTHSGSIRLVDVTTVVVIAATAGDLAISVKRCASVGVEEIPADGRRHTLVCDHVVAVHGAAQR